MHTHYIYHTFHNESPNPIKVTKIMLVFDFPDLHSWNDMGLPKIDIDKIRETENSI